MCFSLFRCFSLFICFPWAFHFSCAFTFEVCFSCTFHFSGVLFTDAPYTHTCYHMHIHAPPNVCIDYHMHMHAPHACTIKGTYMCTIYTYMHHQTHVHHQIPPKYKIYPVGLPSVLYETPGPNERSVLNQLFLVFFIVLFHFSGENCNAFHENRCFS